MVVALESGSLSVEFAPLTARLATVLPTRFHQEPTKLLTKNAAMLKKTDWGL
jgi:glutamate mutase epsilon subunit